MPPGHRTWVGQSWAISAQTRTSVVRIRSGQTANDCCGNWRQPLRLAVRGRVAMITVHASLFNGVGHGLWKAHRAVRDCTMINWDDVRYFLAVARGGSVRAAADRLGVNHATLLRRIAQLEE